LLVVTLQIAEKAKLS